MAAYDRKQTFDFPDSNLAERPLSVKEDIKLTDKWVTDLNCISRCILGKMYMEKLP